LRTPLPGPASSCCAPHSARKRTRHQPRTDYNGLRAVFVRVCEKGSARRACRATRADPLSRPEGPVADTCAINGPAGDTREPVLATLREQAPARSSSGP